METKFDQSISGNPRVENDIRRFAARSCLLSTLHRIREQGRVARLTHADAGTLWVDPANGLYCAEFPIPEAMFCAPDNAIDVRWQAELPTAGARRPVEELFWNAGWHGSNGALLEGCEPYDVVAVVQWPNFTRLPYCQSMITLCAFLHNRPTSLSFAYRSLRIEREDAFRFYSAARAAGLVEVISAQPGATVTDRQYHSAATDEIVPNRISGFWASLVKRLSGL